MPEIEKIKGWLVFLGIPVSFLLIVGLVLLALWVYPQFKLFLSDLLKLFGKSSKWVRRKSIETELEGSINLFTKQFNSELSFNLLPECQVRWVTGSTPVTELSSGKAIIRQSFGHDHDMNFYNTRPRQSAVQWV